MTSARNSQCAPEERGGRPAPQPVTRVGALRVVEAQEGVQRLLELSAAGEVPAAELDAPVLLQQCALEALDEAIRPGMAGLRARVPDPQVAAGLGEGALELGAPIGEDPLERPAGSPVEGHEHLPEEGSTRPGRQRGQDLGHAVGAGGIAGRHLPDFPHALELPQIKRVETHQLPGVFGSDVLPPAR